MTDLRKAAEMALDYIKDIRDHCAVEGIDCDQENYLVEALRQALAQPEQEPVAFVTGYKDGYCVISPISGDTIFQTGLALYTAPISEPVKEPISEPLANQEPVAWQVMVENEPMKEFSIKDVAHDWAVTEKLNGSKYSYWIRPLYAAPPKQEEGCSTCAKKSSDGWALMCVACAEKALKREWVGLTYDEIINALEQEFLGSDEKRNLQDDIRVSKAIEAKLREKNNA